MNTEGSSLQTASQTVGPFFHNALIRNGDNILVNDQTRGERIWLRGRVFDGEGQPVPDAMLEIWQADATGIFNHPTDPEQAQADPQFCWLWTIWNRYQRCILVSHPQTWRSRHRTLHQSSVVHARLADSSCDQNLL